MRLIAFLFCTLCLLFGAIVGILLTKIDYSLTKENYPANIDCNNLSFQNTVKCLNNNFNSFYKYNITNKGKKITEEQLYKEGGVCSHASDWYKIRFDALGFNAKKIDIYSNDSGHEFIVAYDEGLNNYCVIDQREIMGCARLTEKT